MSVIAEPFRSSPHSPLVTGARYRPFRIVKVLAVAAVTLWVSACATRTGVIATARPITPLRAPLGLALHGYDPVAYFDEQRPIKGSLALVQHWRGAEWRFANAQHLADFTANPEHFAPQYGGYCAFAVSRGTTADGDPKQWAIVGDRLFLNNNAFAKALWDRNRDANIHAGDVNWPQIPKQLGQP